MRHPKEVRMEASAIDGRMDISTLDLPRRIMEELREAGIHTIEQINYVSDDELYRILRDIGSRAVDLVKDKLHHGSQHGIRTTDDYDS